jgi:hypothetical protein
MTNQEKIIHAFRALGIKQTGTTPKYLKFIHPSFPGKYIYVGKKGAIRSGKTIADSISVTDLYMPHLNRVLKQMEGK